MMSAMPDRPAPAQPPPMRPTPSERLERIELEDGGALYLNKTFRRRLLAALQKAHRDGWKAGRDA